MLARQAQMIFEDLRRRTVSQIVFDSSYLFQPPSTRASGDARSHCRRMAPASYVLCRNSSNSRFGESVRRRSSLHQYKLSNA
jgi:hypothetical protein